MPSTLMEEWWRLLAWTLLESDLSCVITALLVLFCILGNHYRIIASTNLILLLSIPVLD